MKKFPRHIIAGILTAIYLMIAISPLAPLAMKSAAIAHAITGECTGDCNTCGCSPERMASQTCCCWQKKLSDNRQHQHEEREITCCKNKLPDTKTKLSRSCPCGSNTHLSLWGGEKLELLPYTFNGEQFSPLESPMSHSLLPRLASRCTEPPDPPPKLCILS